MTPGSDVLVDVVVLVIVAVAAWQGWRRGGTSLVLSAVGAVAGVFLGGWLATGWDPSSTALLVVAVVVGGLVGLGLGHRLADALATRRTGGRVARPHLLDRLVGVAAHGALALVLCVAGGALLVSAGPAGLGGAVRDSSVLSAAEAHLPTVTQVVDRVPGLGRVVAAGGWS
ncbi:MAG: hypothetical protein QOE59_237 [Actinomycetota bacterium]|nr:hypothetical protein [Actinomycetota bacterium]